MVLSPEREAAAVREKLSVIYPAGIELVTCAVTVSLHARHLKLMLTP